MATTFKITAPDGTIYHIEGPDGATEQQAMAQAQAQHQAHADLLARYQKESAEQGDPTAGMSGAEKFAAGAGKAVVDLGRGAGQYLGLESRQDVQDSRERDAALMNTGAGKWGNVAGNLAATLPALAIPGVNSVVGAGLLGTALGALQPSTSTRETLLNTGIGGVAGMSGQYLGGKLAQLATRQLASRAANAASLQAQNADRDAVWAAARQSGYVLPPTAMRPNPVNTAVESFSGKAATRQSASARNAAANNNGVRQDLGLAPNSPLTRPVLKGVRKSAGKAYQDVKDALATGFNSDGYYQQDLKAIRGGFPDLEASYPGISKQANPDIQALVDSIDVASHKGPDAVALSKSLRSQARANFQQGFGAGGNPSKIALGRAQIQGAQALEDLIQRTLANGGQGDLAKAWDAARTTIAKSYQAEGALRGGNIIGSRLAQQMHKGKPLSGQMGLAAKFADYFPEVAQVPKSGIGVSKLAAYTAAATEALGLSTHSPEATVLAASMVAAPYALRGAMFSRLGQRMLANPSYAPGLTGTAALQALRGAGNAARLTKGAPGVLLPMMHPQDTQDEQGYARGGLVSARLNELNRNLAQLRHRAADPAVRSVRAPLWSDDDLEVDLPADPGRSSEIHALQEAVRGYARGGVARLSKGGDALKALAKAMESPEELKTRVATEAKQAKAPEGMFSVLDQLIQQAPNSVTKPEQWQGWLSPGRAFTREGVNFPLKKDELDFTRISDVLQKLKEQQGGTKFLPDVPRELTPGQKAQAAFQQWATAQGYPHYDTPNELYEASQNPHTPHPTGVAAPSYAHLTNSNRWEEFMNHYGAFDRLGGNDSTAPKIDPLSPEALAAAKLTPVSIQKGDLLDWLRAHRPSVGGTWQQDRYSRYTPSWLKGQDPHQETMSSLTQLGDLTDPNIQKSIRSETGHYDESAPSPLSWSRSVQSLGPSGVGRVINEIQSDVHGHASDKVATPKPETLVTRDQLLAVPGIPTDIARQIRENRAYQEHALNTGDAAPEGMTTRRRGYGSLTETPGTISPVYEGVPFRGPDRYGSLELRKMIARMANKDDGTAPEHFLGMANAEDQMKVYGEGQMGGARHKGMQQVYDPMANVYDKAGQPVLTPEGTVKQQPGTYAAAMRKLADQYGMTYDPSFAVGLEPKVARSTEKTPVTLRETDKPYDPEAVRSELGLSAEEPVTLGHYVRQMHKALTKQLNSSRVADANGVMRRQLHSPANTAATQALHDKLYDLARHYRDDISEANDYSLAPWQDYSQANTLRREIHDSLRVMGEGRSTPKMPGLATLMGNFDRLEQLHDKAVAKVKAHNDSLAAPAEEPPRATINRQALLMSPEARERIQRAGVSLFTPAALALGINAMSNPDTSLDGQQPQGFAEGGSVRPGALRRMEAAIESDYSALGPDGRPVLLGASGDDWNDPVLKAHAIADPRLAGAYALEDHPGQYRQKMASNWKSVDDTIGLPATLAGLGSAVGNAVTRGHMPHLNPKTYMGIFLDKSARRGDRGTKTEKAVDEERGVPEADGLLERTEDLVGHVIGQWPNPFGEIRNLGTAAKIALEVPHAIAEYLLPAIKTKGLLKNYAHGILGGEIVNEGANALVQHPFRSLRPETSDQDGTDLGSAAPLNHFPQMGDQNQNAVFARGGAVRADPAMRLAELMHRSKNRPGKEADAGLAERRRRGVPGPNKLFERLEDLHAHQRSFADGGLADGAIVPGNLDPFARKALHNPDGSTSTTLSFSIATPKGEVLIPQVVNGEKLSREQAIDHYHASGEHLGIFPDWQSADGYAKQLHNDQARRMGLGQDAPSAPMDSFLGAPMPSVARLLSMAARMNVDVDKLHRTVSDGMRKPKGYAKGGPVLAGLLHSFRDAPKEMIARAKEMLAQHGASIAAHASAGDVATSPETLKRIAQIGRSGQPMSFLTKANPPDAPSFDDESGGSSIGLGDATGAAAQYRPAKKEKDQQEAGFAKGGAALRALAKSFEHERPMMQHSWESNPGATSAHLPELRTGSPAALAAYHQRMEGALLDRSRMDRLIASIGHPEQAPAFDAPGVFNNQISPGTQSRSAVSVGAHGLDPADAARVKATEMMRAYALGQDAAAGHVALPVQDLDKADTFSVVGPKLSEENVRPVQGKLDSIYGQGNTTVVGTDKGFNILNLGADGFGHTGASTKEALTPLIGDHQLVPGRRAESSMYEELPWAQHGATKAMLASLKSDAAPYLEHSADSPAVRALMGHIAGLSEAPGLSPNQKLLQALKAWSGQGLDALRDLDSRGLAPAVTIGAAAAMRPQSTPEQGT